MSAVWMTRRVLQLICLSLVAGCSAARAPGSSDSASAPFTERAIADFSSPWAMDFLPGSGAALTPSALLTEKQGRLWLVNVDSGAKQAVAGVPRVIVSSQGGLLDVKAAPDFAASRAIYLTYAEPSANGGSGLALARARLDVDAAGARLTDLKVIWHDPEGGQGGQFGAIIAFAPDHRSLFLTVGERQRFTPAQDPNSPLGKILHLTLDGQPIPIPGVTATAGAATVTTTDSPQDTIEARTAPGRTFTWPGPNLTPAETWTMGHRNPYGLAFDSAGRLWETEMGPKGGDELNVILPGRNYGWPLVSNGSNYDGVDIPDHRAGDGFEAPKLWWNPSISPAGLLIYSGDRFPGWNGDALIPALSGQALIRVELDGANARKADQWDMDARIRSIDEGPGGRLFILEDGGGLKELIPKR